MLGGMRRYIVANNIRRKDGNGLAAQSGGNLQTATAQTDSDEVSKGDGKETAKLSENEKEETGQGKGDIALQAGKSEESGQIGTRETAENKAKQAPTEIMDKPVAMAADDKKPTWARISANHRQEHSFARTSISQRLKSLSFTARSPI